MKANLLFVLLFCSIAASAQFVQGQHLINAHLNMGSSNSTSNIAGDRYGSNIFYTSLSLQRFSTPTLLKGFGIGYSYNENYSSGITTPYRLNSFTAFYQVTKLQPLAKKFYFTYGGNLSGQYEFGTNGSVINNDIKHNGAGISAAGSLGLLYQLTPRLILTGELANLLRLGYFHGTDDKYITSGGSTVLTEKVKTNSFGFEAGLNSFGFNSFTFGLSYLLNN